MSEKDFPKQNCATFDISMNTYQELAAKTAIYPNAGKDIFYPVLGLVGEAGELANKVKKILRDDAGVVTDEKKQELMKELGDVQWYVSELARVLGFNLAVVATNNISKLAERKKRGTITGTGDDR